MPAVQAPAEDEDGFIKDEFYQELDKVYDSVAISSTKIMLGDLNAKMGKEMTPRGTTVCIVYMKYTMSVGAN